MASVTRDFSITFVSKILLLGIGIGTQSCLAWFLGPGGRGSFAICFTYATILRLIFAVGCDIAGVYFVSSKRFTISEGIVHAFVYGGIGSILAIVTGLVLMQFHFSFFAKAEPLTFYLALASIPVHLFSYLLLLLVTAVHRFMWYAILSLWQATLTFLFTLLFVKLLGGGVNGAFLAILLSGLTAVLSTLVFFRWRYAWRWVRPTWQGLAAMFRYGARYYVGKVSNEVNFRLGTVILGLFATKEEVGWYDVASLMAVHTMIIPDTLITVMIPKASSDVEGKKVQVAQSSRFTFLTCGMLLLFLALIARPVITVLFSPEFEKAVIIFRILAVGTLVRSTCKVFVPYLLGTDHPGMVSLSVATGVLVNLGMMMLLLPRYGMEGVAVSMVIGYVVSSLLLTLGFLHYSQMSLRQTWLYNHSDWRTVRSIVRRVRGSLRRAAGNKGGTGDLRSP